MWRSLLSLFFLASPVFAELGVPSSWTTIPINKWGGIDILNDSTLIDPSDAVQAVNVLTDSGYLEKRPGNVNLNTFCGGNSQVLYSNEWLSPSGTRYLIAECNNAVWQTTLSSTGTQISPVSTGTTISAVSAFSKLFVDDGSLPLWYWDGNSSFTFTGAPTCTYIEYKDSRIYCGNQPNVGSSTLLVSSYASASNATSWTVPPNAAQNDAVPNSFSFNPNDGDSINCLKATPWGLYVGKKYSSWVLKGNGNLTYAVYPLDTRVGCIDNRTVQMVNGVLMFLSVDGVYGWDGRGYLQLMSRKLDPLFPNIRESLFSQGVWNTQLQSDWKTGTVSTNTANPPTQGSWDFNSVAGQVFPSSFTMYDDNSSSSSFLGVGFGNDTLTFIDTATYGGAYIPSSNSGGAAQLGISTSGVVIVSTNTGGLPTIQITPAQYLAFNPGWFLLEGNFDGRDYLGGGLDPLRNVFSGSRNTIYSTSFSTQASANASLGSMFGYWQFTGGGFSSAVDGQCDPFGGTCAQFNFIINSTTFNVSAANDGITGYGLQISQNAAGTGNSFTLQLNKYIAGVITSLGSYIVPFTATSGADIFVSTFGVSRTIGGLFTVYYGTTSVFTAQDKDPAITNNAATAISEYSFFNNPFDYSYNIKTFRFSGYASSGTIISRTFDSNLNVPLAGLFHSTRTFSVYQTASNQVAQGPAGDTAIYYYLRSSTSPNNDDWTAWTASSDTIISTTNMTNRYWQYQANFQTIVSSETPQLYTVDLVGATTGYYDSKVNFIGTTISAWTQFSVSESSPGSFNYFVRGATYAFADCQLSSYSGCTPSWTKQNANQNVAISTFSYAQFRLDSSSLAYADQAEPISRVALNYQQGTNLPAASASLNRRYFVCVVVSTASAAPDTCLLWQRNGKWVYWKGPLIGSMGLYNNNIIAGDGGTSGKVWEIMQPGIYSDDGAAISAIWQTQDFTGKLGDQQDTFTNDVIHELWLDAIPILQGKLTVTYSLSKSTNVVTLGNPPGPINLDLGNSLNPFYSPYPIEYGVINKWLPIQNGYDVGKYYNFQFSDATVGSYFRIADYLIFIEPKGRTVP